MRYWLHVHHFNGWRMLHKTVELIGWWCLLCLAFMVVLIWAAAKSPVPMGDPE